MWFNILLHTQSIVCATVLQYKVNVLGIYNFAEKLKTPYKDEFGFSKAMIS
jgi:hypothetical protein